MGQKQSRSSYVHGSRSIASNFWLSMFAFAKPADFEFSREGTRLVEQQEGWHHWKDISRAPELAI